jgi:hypothetical protein
MPLCAQRLVTPMTARTSTALFTNKNAVLVAPKWRLVHTSTPTRESAKTQLAQRALRSGSPRSWRMLSIAKAKIAATSHSGRARYR